MARRQRGRRGRKARRRMRQSYAEWAIQGRAILVGVGYYQYRDRIRGSASDARRMKDALALRGFRNTALIVDSIGTRTRGKPFRRENVTASAITEAISDMIRTAKPGDTLVVFMAGHGGIETPFRRKSRGGYFLAGDGVEITDEFFRKELEFLTEGCDFVLILDSCCAGSFKIGQRGIVLAACKWFQLSKEYVLKKSELYGGLFTDCLVNVMKKYRNEDLSYYQLIAKVRDKVMKCHRKEGLGEEKVVVWENNGRITAVLPENVTGNQMILGRNLQIPVIHAAGGRGNRVFLGDAL